MGSPGESVARPNEDTALRVRSFYERTLTPGESLFDQGDSSDQIYVVQSGEIELSREGPMGHRVVAHLGPGDFLGELAVVAGERQTARAVAVKNTRVLALDRETLEAMCLAQPEIAIRLIRILVARLIEAERRLAMLGVDDLIRPVVRALLRRADPENARDGRGIPIATSLRELAQEAGLSMLEAHRALHTLFERKLIQLTEEGLVTAELDSLTGCLDPGD